MTGQAGNRRDWSRCSPVMIPRTGRTGTGVGLGALTAGVSADGQWLAFVSDRELTSYDNHDARSGMPDEEVFLYHAGVRGAGGLVCASCDPTGARPEGVEYEQMVSGLAGGSGEVFAKGQWVAASLPGYVAYKSASAPFYRPRYLSDEGRLFFDSSDALVPQDVNGTQSVYEYEPAGVGGANGCSASLSIYVPGAAGCVGLISSGTAAGEAVFVDAGESGDDVFFETTARLTGQDTDNALDIYDAHACATGSPCRVESPAPPACTTADACRAAASPEPEVFGAPGSTATAGPGNLTAASTTVSPAVVKTAVKKIVKCKRGDVKDKHGRCVRKPKKKSNDSHEGY